MDKSLFTQLQSAPSADIILQTPKTEQLSDCPNLGETNRTFREAIERKEKPEKGEEKSFPAAEK